MKFGYWYALGRHYKTIIFPTIEIANKFLELTYPNFGVIGQNEEGIHCAEMNSIGED